MKKVTSGDKDADSLSSWSSVGGVHRITLESLAFPTEPVRPRRQRSRAAAFRARYFPGTRAAEWADWRWQLKHAVRSTVELERFIRLTDDERAAGAAGLPLQITPHYLSLIDPDDPVDPIRRCMVPTRFEQLLSPGEETDPLSEEAHSPVPGLVHRYPDRVLFLAHGTCAAYCRYCTRSRLVGDDDKLHGGRPEWSRCLDYIAAHPEVRDVLVSGGDPLMLKDELLDWLLARLRAIPHVEIIRIGTKVPMVLPQRVTPALCRVLRRYHPVWMSIHCTHPVELTPEVQKACNRLADAGVVMGSQTVLLKGINDDVPTLKALFHGLMKVRIKPYYLYQCDPTAGTAHFRTSVQTGLEMIRGLRGHTSGYAVPTYAIDAPGGGGKVPLLPEYVVGHDAESIILRNYEGNFYRYPDPIQV